MLWAASCVSKNTVVLKVVSVSAALIFSGLFFFRSPFPPAHRLLFLLGVLPLHIYSVIARNYGISAVFIFLIALEHSRPRESSPWIIGLCNALLANTNVYGAFCAIGFMLLPWRFAHDSPRQQQRSWWIVVLLTALGGLALVYTVWPSRANLVNRNYQVAASGRTVVTGQQVAQAVEAISADNRNWTACLLTGYDPTKRLTKLGLNAWRIPFNVAGLVAIVWLLRASALRMAFLSAFLLAWLFARLVYPADERHLGVLTMFLLALFWIRIAWDSPSHPRYRRWILTGLFLSFLCHAVMGIFTSYVTLRYPYSQSKNAGRFLASGDPKTIVVCEPDFYGDVLPYYAANDIYNIREGRFRPYVTFTAPYNRSIKLADIQEAVERVENETQRRVFVAFPFPIEQYEEGRNEGGFGRDLIVVRDEVRRFQERFVEVASFLGEGNETFVFYAAAQQVRSQMKQSLSRRFREAKSC